MCRPNVFFVARAHLEFLSFFLSSFLPSVAPNLVSTLLIIKFALFSSFSSSARNNELFSRSLPFLSFLPSFLHHDSVRVSSSLGALPKWSTSFQRHNRRAKRLYSSWRDPSSSWMMVMRLTKRNESEKLKLLLLPFFHPLELSLAATKGPQEKGKA